MANRNEDNKCIYKWIGELCREKTRPVAMQELCERRGHVKDLGLFIWHAFGAVAGLLQELTAIHPDTLANEQSQRLCLALGLFQAIAAHPDTGLLLLRSQIMHFLLPLLKVTRHSRAADHARLSVMGVVCGLLRHNSREAVTFLLDADLVAPVLRQLELGPSIGKSLAAFILHRLMLDEQGLAFMCQQLTRLLNIIYALGHVCHQLMLEPEPRILKHVVRSYTRLADNEQANELLLDHLPEQLRHGYFCAEYLPGYEQAPFELCELNRKVPQR